MTKFLRLNKDDWNQLSKIDVIEILRSHLETEKSAVLGKLTSEDNFNKSSWSEHQAYLLGGVKQIDKLINFLPDKGK